MRRYLFLLSVITLMCTSCQSPTPPSSVAPPDTAQATLEEDLTFLQQHGTVHVLEAPNGGRVVLSPQYQGRVMTSGVASDGRSFGWVNRDFIASGDTGTSFDNYGGEDRFWLGPEAGPYGFFFEEDASFELENWFVPEALNEGAWTVEDQSDQQITLSHSLQLTNYQGTSFQLDVERSIRLLDAPDVQSHFGVELPEDVDWVGFESINQVTNTGDQGWTRRGGQPSIWILGQFESFQGDTKVVVPYDEEGTGEIVNADYFQSLSEDRLVTRNGYIFFKADGKYRSKIGVGPERATPMFGSYNPSANLLTLIQYDLRPEADYVNSLWEDQEQPYEGDVINVYNDSPTDDEGSSFYELESSSPALELNPDESYTHPHRTLHIVGDSETLSRLMEETLGVSATTLAEAL